MVFGLGFRLRLRSVFRLQDLNLPWRLDDQNDASKTNPKDAAHTPLFPAIQCEGKSSKHLYQRNPWRQSYWSSKSDNTLRNKAETWPTENNLASIKGRTQRDLERLRQQRLFPQRWPDCRHTQIQPLRKYLHPDPGMYLNLSDHLSRPQVFHL